MPNALDSLVVVLRATTFITLLQAAGVALYLVLFRNRLVKTSSSVRSLGVVAAFIGTILVVARYLVEPARLTGTLSGMFDVSMHAFVVTSNLGVSQSMRLLGAAIVGFALLRSKDPPARFALVGVALIALSFSFMGHTVASDQRWLLSGLLTTHLLAASFWFGSLIPLHLASAREPDAGNLIRHFSSIAIRIVPFIFIAGVGMAFVLLPSVSSLRSPYGILLIVKVLSFSALMGLAALNKCRLGPALESGHEPSAALFRRSVAAEIMLIILILGVTATMTTHYSPEH